MKKTIMFLGMLAVGFANAQQTNDYDGKVGVNTNQPTATLNVKSKTGKTASTKNLELENASNTKLVTVLDDGKVGIGVEAPTQKLHVKGNILAEEGGLHSSLNSAVGGFLELINPKKTTAESIKRWRLFNMIDDSANNGADYTNGLHFWAYGGDGNNLSSKMVLTDEGNLGIGFNSRVSNSKQTKEKLEVDGKIRSTALEGAGDRAVYADENGVLKIGASITPITELWAQRTNGSITETYLKPATESGDEYMYSPKKSYINLGNVAQDDLAGPDGTTVPNNLDIKGRTPHLTMINASALGTHTDATKFFSRDIYSIKPATGQTITNTSKYLGKDFYTVARDLGSTINYAVGFNQELDFISNTSVDALVGGRFYSTSGSQVGNYTQTKVNRNIALRTAPMQYSGTTGTIIGILNEPRIFGGKVDNIFGEQTSVYSTSATNSIFPSLSLKYMIGNRMTMITQPNTTSERTYGGIFYNYFKNNSVISTEASGIVTSGYFEDGSNVKNYSGYVAYLNGDTGSTVDKIHGYLLLTSDLKDNFTTKEMYGMYLANVNKGTEKNFAIYTNEGTVRFGDKVGVGVDNPTEKLEVKGAVKIGTTDSTCTAANAGTMSYKEVKGSGVFGFCTKKASGEYVWAYLKGAQLFGESADGGAFGNGL